MSRKKPGAFRDLPAAMILLRARARKTIREVAKETGLGVTVVRSAEGRRESRPSLETVDTLLTYYGADLALVAELLEAAGGRVKILRPVRGRALFGHRVIQEIWREVDARRRGGGFPS